MSRVSGLGGRLYRGDKSFNIVSNSRRWYAISGLVIIVSAIALGTQGLHLGIEFKGGAQFTFTQKVQRSLKAKKRFRMLELPLKASFKK